VMDLGRIVERGTHEALLRAGGPFAQMWALQQQQQAAREEPADQMTANGVGH
ncbi:MAG: ATP-binding cassette, subfamily heavy metal transporter, partial [Paraburkholderia sp.]|nr:ATP-binding cassette, subfamily heavy metal transporter [Paraburkholderia sp.]